MEDPAIGRAREDLRKSEKMRKGRAAMKIAGEMDLSTDQVRRAKLGGSDRIV
jgi:hypothetical protein